MGDVLTFSEPHFFEKLERFIIEESADLKAVLDTVATVLAAVRKRGDDAILAYTRQWDKVSLKATDLRVAASRLETAVAALPQEDREAIEAAIQYVRDFHQQTLPQSWKNQNAHGAMVGEHFYPIQRVGLYIPGGNAPLVSTVVMIAVLAQLAGVPEIAVCTPPQSDGEIHEGLLAALGLCRIKEVYRVGGIQAIGALAYGTPSVPAVTKIFGPGNAFVTEAKRQVFGTVGIDLLPGPSEIMVLADQTAHAAFVAADLLSQAEHGSGKEKLFLVTTEPGLVKVVDAHIKTQLAYLRHAAAIENVLRKGYLKIVTDDLDQAIAVANFIAPEHLELHVTESELEDLSDRITTAGAMLMGAASPTVLGDFVAGPSHTLPTGRTGRFTSGLQVRDFMRRTSLVRYQAQNLAAAAPIVETFSRLEGLDAHDHSLKIRLSHDPTV